MVPQTFGNGHSLVWVEGPPQKFWASGCPPACWLVMAGLGGWVGLGRWTLTCVLTGEGQPCLRHGHACLRLLATGLRPGSRAAAGAAVPDQPEARPILQPCSTQALVQRAHIHGGAAACAQGICTQPAAAWHASAAAAAIRRGFGQRGRVWDGAGSLGKEGGKVSGARALPAASAAAALHC